MPETPEIQYMQTALQLAAHGQGRVEPNPMVGAVIVRDGQLIGSGHHEQFGGPHAEVMALRNAAKLGNDPRGATIYVTLEPCCHHGKTPPCSQAIINAGLARAVVAQRDPFPKVDGGGVRQLEAAGVQVDVGLCEDDAQQLNAPYLTLVEKQRPWMIAKWAMTLDGKTATRTGSSRWISNEQSRRVVHELRSRVDGVMVGGRTAMLDDPMLDARLEDDPTGSSRPSNGQMDNRQPGVCEPARKAARIVVAGRNLPTVDSRLAQTAHELPVLIFANQQHDPRHADQLRDCGIELIPLDSADPLEQVRQVTTELGRRCMTNILLEGGGRLTGSMLDAQLIDELHIFIAPKLCGGAEAATPVAGLGLDDMTQAPTLNNMQLEQLGTDLYLHGRI